MGDSASPTTRSQERLTPEDVGYIRANFVGLASLCRERGEMLDSVHAQIEGGRLPKPAYVLDDGTEMVPADYFACIDDAGGPDRLREHFRERYVLAAAATGEVVAEGRLDEEWRAYLSGEYGVCLRRVTPENIFRKSWLMGRIERSLTERHPDAGWRDRLAAFVDELDGLERDFAPFDRRRWGPVSRDRLITAVRERYGLSSALPAPPHQP